MESDPGANTEKKSRFKVFKRFLKRQETVSSYSSNDTIDKLSNQTPSVSIDGDSVGVSIPSGINVECEQQKIDDNETTEFMVHYPADTRIINNEINADASII